MAMKWRDIVGWVFAGLLTLVILAIAGAYLFLKSDRFQQIAIRKVTQATDEATGGKSEIRALDLSLRPLQIHLFDVKIHGNEQAGQPPLLQLENLSVGVTIQSLLHQQFNLNNVVLGHPVIYMRTNQTGATNLPNPPAAKPGDQPSTNVFQLAVGHFQIVNGELNYDDKKTPLVADLHHLDLNAHFDSGTPSYYGTIAYDDGHLKYAQLAVLPHNLRANFKATASTLSLDHANVAVGASTGALNLQLTNYSDPSIAGDYKLRVHTQDFAALSQGVNPAGDVTLVGKISIPKLNAPSLLRTVTTDGVLLSDALSAVVTKERIEVRRLHGNYHLANASLRTNGIGLEALGGTIRADAEVQHLDATPSTQMRTTFRNISLHAAQQILGRPELKQVSLLSTVDGTSDLSWTGNINNLRATSDLSLRTSAEDIKAGAQSSRKVPIDGVVHVTYDGAKGTIGLHDTVLNLPATRITAQGEVSRRSNLRVHATTSDLQKLSALINAFKPGATPSSISGSATLAATVHGSMKNPDIDGEISAENFVVQGSQWRSLQGNFEATPDGVTITEGSLVNARTGRATFNATLGLHNWAYLPSNPIKATMSVQQVSITDLQQLFNSHYPVSGDISAGFSFSGSQLNPQGSGTLKIAHGRAYDEQLQNFAMKFSADHEAIQTSLDVAIPAGAATAYFSFAPETKRYSMNFDISSLSLQRLRYVHDRNLLLYGYLSASASGSGTIDNPQLTATVQLPKLTLRDKSVFGVKAQLKVADKQADFNLNSLVLDASVQAHGKVNLEGGYYTEASLDTAALPLDVLLALYLPNLSEGVKGQTEFHARLAGPLKDPSQIRADLTIPTLNASYQNYQIGSKGPIHVEYARSVITVLPAEIEGTDTSLRFHGTVPLTGNAAPSFEAQGSVNMRALQMLSADIRSSGNVTLDVKTSGTADHPNVNGQVQLHDVSVIQAGAPLGVEKLNGSLNVDNERVQLAGLSGQVGGGQLTAAGSMTYKPLQFNVAMQAQSVRLRYPNGLRTVLDGNLALTGTNESSVLSGRVLIDSLSFTPDFDLSTFADQFSGDNAPPAQPGFAESINLSIALLSKESLSANSSQVSLEGNANFHVGGTAAVPIITGRTDLSSGELFYRNVRYELQRGIITFDDPYQTHPVLNVSVGTTVSQYNLVLNLRGPFEKLTTSYSSDPPLATADIVNLLATGKTTQQAAASQSTDSMIASQAAGQVSGGVQRLAGLSSLQIDPLIGGNNQNPSARVALQQRVTRNFLFTFSTDVSQPGSEVVQGDYRLSKRWSVSAARKETGGISMEGRFHTSF